MRTITAIIIHCTATHPDHYYTVERLPSYHNSLA